MLGWIFWASRPEPPIPISSEGKVAGWKPCGERKECVKGELRGAGEEKEGSEVGVPAKGQVLHCF